MTLQEPVQPSAAWANRLVLALLWLVFYGSFALFTPPLLDDADSVHAEVAREMLARHDWVTLYANGIRYLEKAPFFYWSMAASMKVLGATTSASRIPLALSVLALVWVVEAFARRSYRSPRAGLYAGLITLSSFGIFIFSRINIPDVMVCLWLTLAVWCYAVAEEQDEPGRLVCWGFAAACALNVLTKGLIGIVFPLAIVGAHLLITRGWGGAWDRVGRYRPWSSGVLFLAMAVPWHVLAGLANPGHGDPGHLARLNGHWSVPYPTDGNVHGWTWFYFINEQVYRYLNLRVPHDYDTSPLWLFYGLILVWLMPWSGYLFHALKAGCPTWARLRRRTLTAEDRTGLLLVLWAAIPLVFFSLSTRQEYYVLPSLPPMIVLLARLLSGRAGRSETRIAGVLAAIGVLAAAVCVWFVVKSGPVAPGTDLATLLQQNPGDYALSFGHFLDLDTRAMGMFRLPLILTAVALGAGLPLAWWLRRRGATHASVLATTGAALLFLLAAHRGLVIFSPTLTSYQLAQAIQPQLHPEDLVVIHGEYEAGSTLGFYLRRNDLHLVEGRSSNLWYGSFFPDAPREFETRQSLAAKWAGPRRIFLWEDPSDAERPVLALPGAVYRVASSGGKRILSNQPNR
jgi:4-amino-4-deoxy-L-arabinose transferase-like glycosyltransferase